jgi:hypothetical protein
MLSLNARKFYHKALVRCCHGTSADYTDFADYSANDPLLAADFLQHSV